ncbi:MAG: type II toxin-antitoxin system VapB family antitoxin [Gammaproteobacteria bacterium]
MKTTVEIDDALVVRVRKHARRTGRTMRSLVEEGLRRCLEAERPAKRYELPDLSVGNAGGPNPLEARPWQDLRDEIYEGR